MSFPRKKVLWLPKCYPNKFDVLDGVFTVEHAKAAAIYSDVFVLYIHSDTQQTKRIEEHYSFSNNYHELKVYFRHKETGIKPVDKLVIGIKYVLTQYLYYRRVKISWGKPALTHIHSLARSSFLALWLKWTLKTPFIITEHWSGFDPKTIYKINKIKRWFIQLVLKNSVCITTVSDYLQKCVQPYAPKANFYILSNTADENIFQPNIKLKANKKRLIHISTLDDYPKNFGNILRVIADLSKVTSEFELHVFGEGVEKEKQIQLAKDLGIYNTFVFFNGYLDKPALAKEIATSDFLILFSLHETQSCVSIEALLCGIPIIVPKLGGVQELVNFKNGKTVKPLDNQDFYNAILALIQNEIEFNAMEIREDALKFGYKCIGKEIAQIYSNY